MKKVILNKREGKVNNVYLTRDPFAFYTCIGWPRIFRLRVGIGASKTLQLRIGTF